MDQLASCRDEPTVQTTIPTRRRPRGLPTACTLSRCIPYGPVSDSDLYLSFRLTIVLLIALVRSEGLNISGAFRSYQRSYGPASSPLSAKSTDENATFSLLQGRANVFGQSASRHSTLPSPTLATPPNSKVNGNGKRSRVSHTFGNISSCWSCARGTFGRAGRLAWTSNHRCWARFLTFRNSTWSL